jgi:hypothetical protein
MNRRVLPIAILAIGLAPCLLSRPAGAQTVSPTITRYTTTTGVTITSAAPNTLIRIVGTNFGSSGTVRMGGLNATLYGWSPTAVTLYVPRPATLPNTGPVQLTCFGKTATGPDFTITGSSPPPPAPTITGYTNLSGAALTAAVPGTSIKIVGTNFGSTGSVTFNNISATPSAWSATSITVPVPSAPSYPNTGPVRVTVSGQTATGANFTINTPPSLPPTISSYTTTTGVAITSATSGTSIKIVGTNFGPTGTVTFNSISATPSAWSATSITVPVPSAASYPNTGPVRVTVSGQTATGANFTINAPPTPAPSITSYTTTTGTSITSAIPGTVIRIVGSNFGVSGSVTIAGINAITSTWTGTVVTATIPTAGSYPATGPVRLTTGGQTATGANFTINAPPALPVPSITGYTNLSGTALTAAVPGTSIKIVGTNFSTTGSVTFNNISATPSAWSATSITVPVPTASSYPNTGPVRVTLSGQTATGANFTINAPPALPPTISSYTTTTGVAITNATPGTSIKIVGTNFGSAGTVTFNSISATPSAWGATSITVPVPSAPSYPNTGPVRVTVSGQTATGANFTIDAPPSPPGGLNVRNYGATGNGSTDDSAAIQRALDAAQSGQAVYFPTGTYRLGAALNLRTSNLRLYGDGDASTITGDTRQWHLFNVNKPGANVTGLRVDTLRFVGARIFDKDINWGAVFYLYYAPGAQITNCTFEGCGMATLDDGGTNGTVVTGCRVRDWGRNGVFCNDGATIQNTSFDQHDPNPTDKVTSHAVYIHGNNVRVQGCTITGVRYYGIQLYGQVISTINNTQIVGNQFSGNVRDIIVTSPSGGPTISDLTISDNSFSNTSSRSIYIQKGDRIQILRNRFDNIIDGVLWLGDWTVGGLTVSNVTVADNDYNLSSGFTPGDPVFNALGAGGSLSNISFLRNRFYTFQSHTGIYLSQVTGATVDGNTLTMGAGLGSGSLCAGISANSGCTAVQILRNTVNGTGNANAYGVNNSGLAGTGSAVTDNILNRCKLNAGGAATSGNIINP